MFYFVLWVVFLLTVLLAVPIAALIEKRRYQIDNPTESSDAEEIADEEGVAEVGEAIDPDPEVEKVAEFAEVEGTDDFPEFDEID